MSDPPPAMELMPPARNATPAAMSRSAADTNREPTVGRAAPPVRHDIWLRNAHRGHGVPVRKWLPLVAICTGTFMLLVDVTIVNVALPDIATDLRTSFTELQGGVDIYARARAAFVPGAGSLAALFGRRKLYLIGLVLFALASLACGLAPNARSPITAPGLHA